MSILSQVAFNVCVHVAMYSKRIANHMPTGKGVPNRLASRNSGTQCIPSGQVPSPEDAICRFQSMGGNLTIFSPFGEDPLANRPDLLSLREDKFFESTPQFSSIFHSLVNGNNQHFRDGLKVLLNLTEQLTPQ